MVDNGLASSQVRWMIQIPRLYETYRETGSIKNFGELLVRRAPPPRPWRLERDGVHASWSLLRLLVRPRSGCRRTSSRRCSR